MMVVASLVDRGTSHHISSGMRGPSCNSCTSTILTFMPVYLVQIPVGWRWVMRIALRRPVPDQTHWFVRPLRFMYVHYGGMQVGCGVGFKACGAPLATPLAE